MPAIIFPTAPTDGQEYTDNNGVVWVWKAIGTSGGKWGRKPVAGGGSITNAAVNTAIAANTTATITALNASAGGGGESDDGKLVKFGAGSLRTSAGNATYPTAGYIQTSAGGFITTGAGGYIDTTAGGYIKTGGYIDTSLGGSFELGFGASMGIQASILTDAPIVTNANGSITTNIGGSISTGENASISTLGGGSFATGTGSLTGGNVTGTIAITANQTFSGTCVFNSITVGGSTDGAVGRQLFSAANTTSALTALGVTMAYCTSDLIRTANATLSNDPVMVISLDAASVYEITHWMEYTSGATPQFKFRLNFSGALDGVLGNNNGQVVLNGGFATPSTYIVTSATGAGEILTRTNDSTRYVYKFQLSVRTLAAVTVAVQWAQNASNAANTTRHAGSYLRAVKISP